MERKNKGDWSEFYAFLKILEERKLPAADKNLKTIEGKHFVFLKLIREEKKQVKIYDISGAEKEILVTDKDGKVLKKFETDKIKEKTLKIFKRIKDNKKGYFVIPEAEILMRELLCSQVKVSSDKKADIVGVLYDRISKTMPMLGFSVKSMVGGASTLLNAGKTTNFIFEVTDFSGNISKVNSIFSKAKIRDRLFAVLESGGIPRFKNLSNKIFDANLKKIDTALPKFIAQMLMDYFKGNASTVADLTEFLSKNKIYKEEFGLSRSDYIYKIKNFLDAAALGMVPSKEWDGLTKAHGGYIVVKQSGEVVCYHLYNRDEFRSYLFENTKFESPSSTRHDYGVLYKKGGKLFFNLNLQIRFIK